jgi:cytidine deaminase
MNSNTPEAAPGAMTAAEAAVLISAAQAALPHSRATYSRFTVAAALRGASGRLYTGVNIENSSYGLTICAERVALFKALSEGETAFSAVAIVTGAGIVCPPCGACRQVLWELAGDVAVIMAASAERYETARMSALLPRAFDDRMLHP